MERRSCGSIVAKLRRRVKSCPGTRFTTAHQSGLSSGGQGHGWVDGRASRGTAGSSKLLFRRVLRSTVPVAENTRTTRELECPSRSDRTQGRYRGHRRGARAPGDPDSRPRMRLPLKGDMLVRVEPTKLARPWRASLIHGGEAVHNGGQSGTGRASRVRVSRRRGPD